MNHSAVVIPVTKANKKLDTIDDSYEPISAEDKRNWDACKCTNLTERFESYWRQTIRKSTMEDL